METARRKIRSYTHRNSTLSDSREQAFQGLYDRFGMEFKDTFLDWQTVFENPRNVVADVGSGMGEATIRFALENPNTNVFAVEVYKPGVDRLLREVEALGLKSLRVCRHDAVEVFEHMIPPGSLAGVHLFFPDPWPKRKHRKRRLVQPAFTRLVASRLRPGGYVHAVTDWEDYAVQILRLFHETEGLTNPYNGFAPSMPTRPVTRYEKKGRARDRAVRECLFVRPEAPGETLP
jgi:tRNA (guanine-N7-)-methyltransferase